MTVKELKNRLEQIIRESGNDDLHVTICDYTDDSDEVFTFLFCHGAEIVESHNKKFLSIFHSPKP